MAVDLKSITIRGFKSLKNVEDFELRPLNVLIGANGSGKSNFLQFFKMLKWMYRSEFGLGQYVSQKGGADGLLFGGNKHTQSLFFELRVHSRDHDLEGGIDTTLVLAEGNSLAYAEEGLTLLDTPFRRAERKRRMRFKASRTGSELLRNRRGIEQGHTSLDDYLSEIPKEGGPEGFENRIFFWGRVVERIGFHVFHDTGPFSNLRKPCDPQGESKLKEDGENLPLVLRRLREYSPDRYRTFVDVIRLALPFLDDFVLEPENEKILRLGWRERSNPDRVYYAHQASDGMLRFIALMTLLSQAPKDLPEILVIDEPELGLHPAALSIVMDYVKGVANQGCQVILATQSLSLIDMCEPEDIVVAERNEEGATTLRRLDKEQLEGWLGEYSLSQLWQSNTLGGSLA